MAELRWNPMIKDWVMIASHRQNRPQMPKDWCPFCPGSGKVPDSYDVYKTLDETYLREMILRYANWFAGSNRYDTVRERYEL